MVKMIFKIKKIAMFAIVLLPMHSGAQDFTCPAFIRTDAHIVQVPSGWNHYTNKSKNKAIYGSVFFLTDMEFVEGDDIDFLVSSSSLNNGDMIKYYWQFSRDKEYEIDCGYGISMIRLTRKLPSYVNGCEVAYKKNHKGNLSFSSAHCN